MEKLYICPGEAQPITRAVHLSRLAAFYPACRDCPLRGDTGHLPRQMVARFQNTERRVERKSLFTREGVRGIYLNELTRRKAGTIASAFAALLWEDAPLAGRIGAARTGSVAARTGSVGEAARGSRPSRPAVVVGHDERPSSPDIVTGVASALRRMGCQVIDISLTTRACFWFAVDHLQATAGVFVTGAGRDPSWTGLDFVTRGSLPLSQRHGLDRLEERLRLPAGRPTRDAGLHRTFQAFVPYEAGLWKHFHALRPLKIACGCPSRLVRRTLERIFETLPCRLVFVEVPQRGRDVGRDEDPDVLRVAGAVREMQADLGMLIDDDGQRCRFVDERSLPVPPPEITRLIVEMLLAEQPGAAAVVVSSREIEGRQRECGSGSDESQISNLRCRVESAGGRCVVTGGTLAEASRAMREHEAVFGGGNAPRFWFREPFPTCDAILALAKVLAALSRSDAAFSEVIAG